jgi:hypothetical protein
MDRSFLSQPEVIAASRAFVCVRLATYEDPFEAKLLQGIARTGSGELENTAFCLMSPDGKTKLIRGARGIERVYSTPKAMVDGMARIVAEYQPKSVPAALPLAANARLALDIAAADDQPLVVILGKDEASRARLKERVAALAWKDGFIGRFVYTSAWAKELAGVEGMKIESGVIVIRPDKFGMKGNAIAQVEAGATTNQIAETLRKAIAEFKPESKTFQSHVREGQRQGVFWETQIPVSDPMERAARERGRKGNLPKN